VRITSVGGGPAGLYFAILMKRRDRDKRITVLERNAAGQTYGWGVVFWGDLLAKLYENDRRTAREIEEGSFRWKDQIVRVRGQVVNLGGSGSSIGRRRLLDILRRRAVDLGVDVRFEHEVEDPSELADSDLIVACDGANSRLRRLHADRFGTRVEVGGNKFIWLGTSKVFDAFTFPFVHTDAGWIWFHAYGFDSQTSTCVVECGGDTWAGLGFDRLGTDETLARLESIFEGHLDGHSLMSRARERAAWLNFRTLSNRRWHHANLVLMGDAAHTTHFTIGSGTRLAIEDAITLATKLGRQTSVELALKAYEEERRAALAEAQREARWSARWFENVPRYIALDPPRFGVLLQHRFSRPLAHLPPSAYLALRRLARRFPALRRLARPRSETR
jgi:2-polyprenyl-6-methoxyphenol hydroxylase-like FAD-dependent oxidoreductase